MQRRNSLRNVVLMLACGLILINCAVTTVMAEENGKDVKVGKGENLDIKVGLARPDYFGEQRIDVSDQAKFVQNGNKLDITFANGFVLHFDTEKIALQIVSPDGIVLAENMPGYVLGLDYIPEGMGKDVKPISGDVKYKYKAAETVGESATLIFDATSKDGKESRVEWTFVPVKYTINGKVFEGIGDQFFITDRNHFLHKYYMNWRGPVGDEYEGAKSFRFSCYAGDKKGYSEATFGKNQPKQMIGSWGMFIDGGQLFNLIGLGGKGGAILEFMDEPIAGRPAIRSSAQNDAVVLNYATYIGRVSQFYTTPLRFRLLTKEAFSPALWLEMNQYIKRRFQKKYNIPATEPRPMACHRNDWRDNTFVENANKVLPVLEDLGYRRVEIGWVWDRGRSPSSNEVYPPKYEWDGKELQQKSHLQTDINAEPTQTSGGVEGLKKFVDIAHDKNMEVYVWHQTAHGWLGSPDVRNHPDWVVYQPDGTTAGWAVSDPHILPVIWYDLDSGWKDSTVKKLKKLKDATNLDGLWLDVYGSGATANFIKPVATFTFDDRNDYIRKLRNLGYGIMTEGVSLASVDSYVIYEKDTESYQKHPFILNGSCPFRTRQLKDYGQLDLFKLMAYQCFPQDRGNVWDIPEDPEAKKIQIAYAAEVKYRNECFNEISDTLGQVAGVLMTDNGSQWVCEKGNAIFSFEPCTVEIASSMPMKAIKLLSPDGPVSIPQKSNDDKEWKLQVPAKSVLLLKTDAAKVEK